MKTLLLLTSILFISFDCCFGQNIGASEIKEGSITPWKSNELSSYQGIYHFGEGDGSNLILLINDSTITVQIRNTQYWVDGGYAVEGGLATIDELDTKWEFKNLSNVSIQGNKFFSDQYQGEFVIYTDSTSKYFGLKIYNPWNTWVGKGRYEIGLRTSVDLNSWFPGKYPHASTKFLTDADLKIFTKLELKIMRNEIFARYGYVFAQDREMQAYFNQQSWYNSRYSDVSNFLTKIELANIESINRQNP